MDEDNDVREKHELSTFKEGLEAVVVQLVGTEGSEREDLLRLRLDLIRDISRLESSIKKRRDEAHRYSNPITPRSMISPNVRSKQTVTDYEVKSSAQRFTAKQSEASSVMAEIERTPRPRKNKGELETLERQRKKLEEEIDDWDTELPSKPKKRKLTAEQRDLARVGLYVEPEERRKSKRPRRTKEEVIEEKKPESLFEKFARQAKYGALMGGRLEATKADSEETETGELENMLDTKTGD